MCTNSSFSSFFSLFYTFNNIFQYLLIYPYKHSTVEKGKGMASKGCQIMRGALDALLNPADLSFAPVTPMQLLSSLHLLVTTEKGKVEEKRTTSNVMCAIDYCLNTELKERFTGTVLKNVILELLHHNNNNEDSETNQEKNQEKDQ